MCAWAGSLPHGIPWGNAQKDIQECCVLSAKEAIHSLELPSAPNALR